MAAARDSNYKLSLLRMQSSTMDMALASWKALFVGQQMSLILSGLAHVELK